MQTLAQLRAGELKGTKRLNLTENLTQFPNEIFTLADSLEVLDLSNNQLSNLPSNLAELPKLKRLFCSNNLFTEVPEVLATCPNLKMIGFKSNQITNVSETALPKHTEWLILTDNRIEALPESFGDLRQLRKCALAGNRLKTLPKSISGCQSLELLRISANQLSELPDALLSLPKLAWLAFSGNPLCKAEVTAPSNEDYQQKVALNQLILHEQIGEGASGLIHRANWSDNETVDLAAKLFKGKVTSDGYPEDELAICLKVGNHPNLVEMVAPIESEQQTGMLMHLIPSHYKNLGNPPSLETCTRDTFEESTQFDGEALVTILQQMAQTMQHLHAHQVSHGDLYAHNILINEDLHILLGDFGAASDFGHLPHAQQHQMRQVELKAFANLAEDLLATTSSDHSAQLIPLIQLIRDQRLSDFKDVSDWLNTGSRAAS